ncbi:MAG TPA: ABC transporter substrate-binding protein [Terracidiphilus sp.]|nr:ABC transporter substrate-binding protein [Terracidiphilus sp.]
MRFERFPRFIVLSICALLACALSGCHTKPPTAPGGLAPIRLQLDWYPQPEHGGFYAAQLLGYYKSEGLDVSFLPLSQYGSAAQMVATGKADIGLGSSDQVLEWNSNGLPLVGFYATMQHDPQAVMVHANSPIHDFKDLEGSTIAAQTGATWLKYVIARYKLNNVRQIPATLSIANFLADQGYVQQIFVTNEPFLAKQAGADVRALLISSSGYDPYRVAFTTRDFASQHADLLRKFAYASARGWQAYLRDPTATNAYLLKLNPALNPEQEAFAAKALRDGGFVEGDKSDGDQVGHMTAERWNQTYSQLKALGILNAPIDPTSAFSTQFAP